jgi:hypothetical protein
MALICSPDSACADDFPSLLNELGLDGGQRKEYERCNQKSQENFMQIHLALW